jgi:hypothetical protein
VTHEEGTRSHERRDDLYATFRRLKDWLITNVRWFTRAGTLLLALYIGIHSFNAELARKIGTWLAFPEPSLEAVISLILALFILERTFSLEEIIRQPALQISDRVRGDIKRPVPNEEIGDTFVASGSAKGLQQGLHLWLAIEIEGRIWPKEGVLQVEDDGSWTATVFEEGTAEYVSLSLFAANDDGHEYLRSWLRSSDQTGDYTELRRTPGMRRLWRVDGLRRRLRTSSHSIGALASTTANQSPGNTSPT